MAHAGSPVGGARVPDCPFQYLFVVTPSLSAASGVMGQQEHATTVIDTSRLEGNVRVKPPVAWIAPASHQLPGLEPETNHNTRLHFA
jgi:hypothetical protein